MKRIYYFIVTCTLMIACRNNSDKPATDEDSLGKQSRFFWQSSFNDSTGKLEMIKIPGTDSVSSQIIIDFLNKGNPNIRLEMIKSSQDTIYLKIADATYLTQQMGSTGPTFYLSAVVYNLTEIPGINFVTLEFEEGDHASPGTFNRNSFKDE